MGFSFFKKKAGGQRDDDDRSSSRSISGIPYTPSQHPSFESQAHSFPSTSTSASGSASPLSPATHSRFRTVSLDARTELGVPSATASIVESSASGSSWEDLGAPQKNLGTSQSTLPASPSTDGRRRLPWTLKTGSSVSLPLTARSHQDGATPPAVSAFGSEKESQRSRPPSAAWPGRGQKKRAGSIASLTSITGFGKIVGGGGKKDKETPVASNYQRPRFGRTTSIADARDTTQEIVGSLTGVEDESSGFFVRSFRSVSRVQADPISLGPYESLPIRGSPPLPSLPHDSPAPSSPPRFQRPALPGHSSSPFSSYSTTVERSASPTISASAFNFSNRNRSTASLTSLALAQHQGAEVADPRPRFEPTAPKSRRGSFASDLDAFTQRTEFNTPLAPPRPQFSTPSGTRNHSRGDSNESSRQEWMAGSLGLPKSESALSLASYRTANESSASPQKVVTPPTEIAPPLPANARVLASVPGPVPASVSRRNSLAGSDMSFDDAVIRFMEAYDSESAAGSPVIARAPSPPPPITPTSIAPASASAVPNRIRHAVTPSLSLQPASPSPSVESTPKIHERTGSLGNSLMPSPSASSVRAKGATTPKKQLAAAWKSESDSEEEEDDDDEEDEMPLARLAIRNSSSTSLGNLATPPRADMTRPQSSELEVLVQAEKKSLSTSTESEVARRRASQRRSLSAFSLSSTPTAVETATIPAALKTAPVPNQRTYSSPAVPLAGNAYTATDLPLLPPSPHFPSHDSPTSSRSSVTDSAPSTPSDAQRVFAGAADSKRPSSPSIKFDVQTLNNDAERKWKSRMSIQGLSSVGSTTSSHVPRASIAPPRSASAVGFSSPYAHNGRRSSVAPSSTLAPAKPVQGILKNSPSRDGEVFNNMRARHKMEARYADALGRDLNGPGLMRDASDDEDEDDEVPLSALPARSARGSQVAGSQVGSSYGPPSPHGFFPPPSSVGGYSQLFFAPPGVDPALYASLPPDQKMSLHQRSHQMMQMMAAAALQAKAESVTGWETGSSVSAASTTPPPPVRGVAPPRAGGGMRGLSTSASMGNLAYSGAPSMGFDFNPPMGMPPMGMGLGMGMGMGYGYPTMPMPGSRLPPFAPPFAASQPFFQQPQYAASAIGMSGPGSESVAVMGSTLGVNGPPAARQGQHRSHSSLGVASAMPMRSR